MTSYFDWTANPEPDVVSYNLYYGLVSGVYLGHTNTANLFVTITGLRNGLLYYFALTALDAAANESVFSDEITVLTKIARVRI